MTNLPIALLHSLEQVPGFSKETFEQVHAGSEQVSSIRFNPAKCHNAEDAMAAVIESGHIEPGTHFQPGPVPWSSYGCYLAKRPSFTFDPLLHAGAYYVQEASSMFLEQAFKQTVDSAQPLRVLDLCAAPGGKSTLLQPLISEESLLVSNEVIKARAAVLEENMIKWGAANVVVTNNDPIHFARLEDYFDVMVIDAPCSGSGLFRRDPQAVEEWSEKSVQHCSRRQQRIIADVWPALKQHGILIYSTCSYSTEENETIIDWLCTERKAESMRLQVKEEWNIVETVSENHAAYGYRFYPDKLKGEGFFIAAIKKMEGDAYDGEKPVKRQDRLTRTEEAIARPWIRNDTAYILFKQKEDIIALPAKLENEIYHLQSALYIKKAGITIGKLAGKDLIPDHALAVSSLVNNQIPQIELSMDQAIQYLRRQQMPLETSQRGWCLVSYKGHNLGWIKVLPNRFNNYYPKEWRILKQPAMPSQL